MNLAKLLKALAAPADIQAGPHPYPFPVADIFTALTLRNIESGVFEITNVAANTNFAAVTIPEDGYYIAFTSTWAVTTPAARVRVQMSLIDESSGDLLTEIHAVKTIGDDRTFVSMQRPVWIRRNSVFRVRQNDATGVGETIGVSYTFQQLLRD